jgi:hypothetical protein
MTNREKCLLWGEVLEVLNPEYLEEWIWLDDLNKIQDVLFSAFEIPRSSQGYGGNLRIDQRLAILNFALRGVAKVLKSDLSDAEKAAVIDYTGGDVWGCTDRNAINWDELATLDCCCKYMAAEPPEG